MKEQLQVLKGQFEDVQRESYAVQLCDFFNSNLSVSKM